MLVLSRKEDQEVVFPSLGIRVSITSLDGHRVKLGIEAPKSVPILRAELLEDDAMSDAFRIVEECCSASE